jgi:AAHS family 4-hydroxybenzoate transporter-like MFS transporter
MNLLNVFLLASWLPTVVKAAGYSASTAVLVGTTLQVGALIGTVVLGWLIERLGFIPVLSTCFLIAYINVARAYRCFCCLLSCSLQGGASLAPNLA